ncbi:MAG: (2Fe-2S)-binding protein [Ignavibacteria bacterium CG2_30_36_16]|nr:Rieske 2Fe-2S domain-containing protein [Ignavibacteria bacterium]OIP59417.1 MAG: (2Fe-2S)-binding protein [Ignavibacteria bacterium CG2_30_36_16]
MADWIEIGLTANLAQKTLTEFSIGKTKLAVSYVNGEFGIISGVCNHVGGPLGEGTLDADYVVCPWHFWKFHHKTGKGEPGFAEDKVPSYNIKIEDGKLFVDLDSVSKRNKLPHAPHPLTRKIARKPGGVRLVAISTTAMNKDFPRYSTSDHLLNIALDHAASKGCETKLFKLNDMNIRTCEGYYSKSAKACTFPCSITQIDPTDEMEKIYEAFVHWGDAFIISTPIRWGAASSLYFKIVERMNSIQNQETIAGKHLLKNKVVGLIITGGQDNVQAVAGSMLGFFAELGCQFPQFPYIAHSRGWSAEDMENNVKYVKESKSLNDGACALVDRIFEMASLMIGGNALHQIFDKGGRKAAR